MGRSSVIIQYLAAICVNINTLSYGIGIGWPSPSFPILSSNDTTLPSGPMPPIELSWVGSIMCIGAMVGTIFFGWAADVIGRKKSLLISAIPGILSWIIIIFARNVFYLLIARFLIGFSGGGNFFLVPMYIGEIAEDRVRGTLSAQLIFFCNMGIFFAFVFGNFLSIKYAAMVYFCVPVIYFIGVFFLHETPLFLMQTDREEAACKSLAFYRNARGESSQLTDEHTEEMAKLVAEQKKNNEKDVKELKVTIKDFSTRPAIRAMIIGLGLMTLNQLCGIFGMLNYTATIFAKAGSSLPPNISAIIVGAIQLVGSYVSAYLCDRAGRKLLLLVSSAGACLGLSILGTYIYMGELEYDVSNFTWVPILSFSFIIFIASCGVVTLPYVIVGEIFPEKIGTIAATICITYVNGLCFLVVKFFYQVSQALGMHGCIFLFAGFCGLGIIFVLLFVPETKGKSFEEIQALLAK